MVTFSVRLNINNYTWNILGIYWEYLPENSLIVLFECHMDIMIYISTIIESFINAKKILNYLPAFHNALPVYKILIKIFDIC